MDFSRKQCPQRCIFISANQIGKMFKSITVKKSLATAVLMAGLMPCWQPSAIAKEGMWLPPSLSSQEREMKAAGLQIAIDKIYNENGTGLNNAVVLFGKGCTGEIISSKGLLLTNHHCGYSSAQALSGDGKDFFADGYWAKDFKEELPCKGLTVTFIRKIQNVTDRILQDIADTVANDIRDSIVKVRVALAEKEIAKESGYEVLIKPYFKGNEYWAAIHETFRDIRFVGFPPNGIGAFGGDEENWMWPRHTGDFSIFRVYAGADNKPADYSPDNKPYESPRHFTINTGGIKEGDFTMVYGFPGTTNEYISSFALKHVYSIADPISIEARTRKLDVWMTHMKADRNIFIKYTAKRASVANGWKKWQGEVTGLKLNNVTGKKEIYEREFTKWAAADKTMPWADDLLPRMKKAAEGVDKEKTEYQYIKEAVLGIEIVQHAAIIGKMLAVMRAGLAQDTMKDSLLSLVKAGEGFYKNYDLATDRDVFMSLMTYYLQQPPEAIPDHFKKSQAIYAGNMQRWADMVFNKSLLSNRQKLSAWATNATPADSAALITDPAWQIYDAIDNHNKQKVQPALKEYNKEMPYLERLYMKAQMAQNKNKVFYPDANLTLRLAWGKIKGLDPDGQAGYSWQTTLDEAIALDDTSKEIFTVPAKLKELHQRKDYGRWSEKGVMPLAFIATNHTTGGNSGSPVLNGKGQLIGTNFDRANEGTMSDYYFDPSRCRNISVDIRYTLFIIEKFGGAGWLIDEMDIVTK